LRTAENAVAKEEDVLRSCDRHRWRRGVILSIRETRTGEVTGFRKRQESHLARNNVGTKTKAHSSAVLWGKQGQDERCSQSYTAKAPCPPPNTDSF